MKSFTAKDAKDAKESFASKDSKDTKKAFRNALFVFFEFFVARLFFAFFASFEARLYVFSVSWTSLSPRGSFSSAPQVVTSCWYCAAGIGRPGVMSLIRRTSSS